MKFYIGKFSRLESEKTNDNEQFLQKHSKVGIVWQLIVVYRVSQKKYSLVRRKPCMLRNSISGTPGIFAKNG